MTQNTNYLAKNKIHLGNVEKKICRLLSSQPSGNRLTSREILSALNKEEETEYVYPNFMLALKRLVDKGLVKKEKIGTKTRKHGGHTYHHLYSMDENCKLLFDYIHLDTSLDTKFFRKLLKTVELGDFSLWNKNLV
ncbi:MAG: hypothetical protein AMS17_09855 [Spirochaetes bacterium DG_61]|nr:MAG: hypothetical protein AMS17_09855 [Spirochaetes bacterium DG_61]